MYSEQGDASRAETAEPPRAAEYGGFAGLTAGLYTGVVEVSPALQAGMGDVGIGIEVLAYVAAIGGTGVAGMAAGTGAGYVLDRAASSASDRARAAVEHFDLGDTEPEPLEPAREDPEHEPVGEQPER